jgi:hypothetical protein
VCPKIERGKHFVLFEMNIVVEARRVIPEFSALSMMMMMMVIFG